MLSVKYSSILIFILKTQFNLKKITTVPSLDKISKDFLDVIAYLLKKGKTIRIIL